MKLQQIFHDLEQADIQTLQQSPGILIFLPMLYVAWADSVLSEKEMSDIREKVESQDWLSEEEKQFLAERLDPDNPPTPQQLHEWLGMIRDAAPHIRDITKKSLASLGMEMIEISDFRNPKWQHDKNQKALGEIEEALGVVSREALTELFPVTDQPPPKIKPAPFKIARLKKLLNGDDDTIYARLKEELQQASFEKKLYGTKEAYRLQVLEWCKTLANGGYGLLSYPKAYGGVDNMEGYFQVMEAASYFDVSLVIKYGVQFGLFGGSIMSLGSEIHHIKYLEKIGKMELMGCFAMTETGHGSNVRDIQTTATYDSGSAEFIIDTPHHEARKDYIGNAAEHGQMATVFAQLILDGENHGVSAFLVPIRDKEGNPLKGVYLEDCGHKMGLNGVDNGRIKFEKVRIPRENLLDRFAKVSEQGEYSSPIASDSKRFFTMLGTLVGGRIGIPRSALSAAKCGLTIAIKYAHGRRQFGPPGGPEQLIMDYQAHQRKLMPLLANAYALHFALKHLTTIYLKQKPEDRREIEALAAGLKAYTTWYATTTLQVCREACGGAGYLWANRLGELKADTDIFTTFEGDNTVLMQLVAKSRLAEFKQEFHDIKFFGLIKYIAGQAASSLAELNPIITRKTSIDHLRDPQFHLSALVFREQHLLKRAAQRLKHRIDQGVGSFEAVNQCQNHLIQLAHAYVERVILEQFQNALKNLPANGIKEPLEQLCQLFAINLLYKNRGWYLENGYFEASKSKAIRKQLTAICAEIKDYSWHLVEAFDIPLNLIAAPVIMEE